MEKKSFKSEQKIVIELNSGRFIEAEFVTDTDGFIVTKNNQDLTTGKSSSHNQTFYVSEIKSINAAVDCRLTAHTSDENENVKHESSERAKKRQPIADKPNQSIDKKSFTKQEIEDIQHFINGTMYISQFDAKYHNAITDMKQQKIIAVNSENRFGELEPYRPLIAIVTPNRVYLFDMLLLGPMKKEFKEVFATKSVRKIIHSAAEFYNYLDKTECCALSNAFDTLMYHFALQRKHEHISLKDCFTTYFDLRDDSFKQNFNYQIRPIKRDALIRSALNGLLLVELYWHLNDIVMKPLQTATQQFQESFSNIESRVDLLAHLHNGTYPNIQHIDLNAVNDLKEMFEFSSNE